jgi:hypothetical protein
MQPFADGMMARACACACLLLLRRAGSLGEASVALAMRLQNGLLGEALFGLKQHLAAVAAGDDAAPAPAVGAPTAQQAQQQHAQVLVGQLLHYGAANAAVHAVARMPFDSVEEQVRDAWLRSHVIATAFRHP